MTELSLNISRTINATPEVLFNAWLDPEMLARFMAPGPDMTVPHAASDPVVGGRFDIIMKSGDQELPHAGTYKEISPHTRLVFSWESAMSVDGSIVTLTFKPVDGGTEVNLHHVKFRNEEMRDNHQGGWTAILGKLEAATA
ncbi:MAG: SRPBCC domain-containing protein [Paracoccaceae bacterium]